MFLAQLMTGLVQQVTMILVECKITYYKLETSAWDDIIEWSDMTLFVIAVDHTNSQQFTETPDRHGNSFGDWKTSKISCEYLSQMVFLSNNFKKL